MQYIYNIIKHNHHDYSAAQCDKNTLFTKATEHRIGNCAPQHSSCLKGIYIHWVTMLLSIDFI